MKTIALLTAFFFCLTPLLASPQGPPLQGFEFQNVTGSVGLADSQENGFYIVNLFDDHFTGGIFADLDGDGYPDLALPRERVDGKKTITQQEGGLYIYPNVPKDSNNLKDREFDLTSIVPIAIGHEVVGCIAFDMDNDHDLDLLVLSAGKWDDSGDPAGSGFAGAIDPYNSEPIESHKNLLFRNDGNFVFTEVTPTTDPSDPTNPTGVDGHGLAFTQAPASLKRKASGLSRTWTIPPFRGIPPQRIRRT
ncbi:MAG: FG-GAP repeat domain-containing protein [Planctomycetota bacterium]